MKEERNFLELLEQEVDAYRKSLRQALKVSEELAGILEAAKKTYQSLEERLQGLQELVARGGEDLDRFRQEWEESRRGIEEWRRKLEEQVLEHLKESQNRLSEIQHLTFKRLDRVEDQLGQQKAELEGRMKGLEDRMDEVGQQVNHMEQKLLARHLEMVRKITGLQRQIFILGGIMGLLALGAYLLGR